MSSKRQIGGARVFHLQNQGHITTENDLPAVFKWYFGINWHKFEKRWADVFQIYPNIIHLDAVQFCPSMPLLGFPVFCLSSSIVLNRYFHILINSMTIWSGLKLPKITWPSPFNLSKLNHNKETFSLRQGFVHVEKFSLNWSSSWYVI